MNRPEYFIGLYKTFVSETVPNDLVSGTLVILDHISKY